MTFYYIHFYRKILAKDEGILNRTRLRILFSCIFTFFTLTSILTVIYLVGSRNLLLYRILFFWLLYGISYYLFQGKKPWRITAHFFLCCLALMIWSNVFLIRQSLYVINLQYCFLIISAAYYMLGAKNGLIYSIAAILPVLVDILFNDFLNVELPSQRVNLNYTAYAITIIANFSLIIYNHYLFFKALTKFKKRELLFKQHLEAAVNESKAQAEAKTNFLNTMSHEIRTPLNAVVGMSNLLIAGEKLPEQEENLQVLHFSAQNLMATVNDIIDFNNLDHGQVILQYNPFSLYGMVTNVCNTFKEQANSKQLKFDCLIDEEIKNIMVIGDELRLSQVLFHLIGNAVKFTQAGFVSVSVRPLPDNNKDQININFKIKDSGIGITKNKLQQIFDPFKKKMPRTQRQYQATLGLTIAYRLLKLHDSELEVKSTEGKGTCFQFTIRYEIAGQATEFPQPPQDRQWNDLSGLRVLVVDDEKLNLMVVKKTLAGWKIKADEACNGQIAVEMCSTADYDVVLMDINMPVMDGFEASRLIKKAGVSKGWAPKIVALTASIGAAMDEVNRFPYIDDCVLKPFKPEDLKNKLQKQ